MKKTVLLIAMASVLAVGACSHARPDLKEVRESGDYWSRMDDASALYLRGPKAQHMLHQDIAACVAQVKELVKLGAIRKAEPPKDMAYEDGLARGWDSPSEDGPLYTEYENFTDFETCMNSKGWRRMEYVTPAEAEKATTTFGETVYGLTPNFGKIGTVGEDVNRAGRRTPAPAYNYSGKQ